MLIRINKLNSAFIKELGLTNKEVIEITNKLISDYVTILKYYVTLSRVKSDSLEENVTKRNK